MYTVETEKVDLFLPNPLTKNGMRDKMLYICFERSGAPVKPMCISKQTYTFQGICAGGSIAPLFGGFTLSQRCPAPFRLF